jgi:serine/threonine protein kinase
MSQVKLRSRDSLPGLVLGARYHVDELLAEGGTGCVYRAYDALEGRTVAVKVLQARTAADDGMRRRFLNEAQTTMRIDSDHVVEITDLGELDDGSAFYVMEFLDGLTLDECRVDSFEDVRAICLQICAGLEAAHARGVVHRDLKPENIIVTKTDEGAPFCRLIDFGIAKLPFATLVTMPGQVLGTPAYLAPEQARAGTPIDHRCDIYALGVVLYELVCGVVPFHDDDPIRMALAHLSAPPQPIAEREPSCPADLATLIMRCLSKDPAARYANVATLAAELATIPLDSQRLRSTVDAPEVSATLLSEEPGLDCARRVHIDRHALGISVSDLLGIRRAKQLTPPRPQPWLTPLPDSGAMLASSESPDWLLRIVVSAAVVLAIAAIGTVSTM